jgi:dipeptidase D
MEKKPVAVLQGHLDMVCEKNKNVVHDFMEDPIRLKREGDWLRADGTSLGADNGIGVAAALAIMEDEGLQHGPLELLFTVDEETGLTGAGQLAGDMIHGKVFFNLDSEDQGTIYIGCAGGRNTDLSLKLETENIPSGYEPFRIRVGGLQGGHSGLHIHEGRGNAIKLLARFLWDVAARWDIRISEIEGGNKVNAIPRECEVVGYLPSDKLADLRESATAFEEIYKEEYHLSDGGVFVRLDETVTQQDDAVMKPDCQERLLNLLCSLPHGVIAMSLAMPGLVETSTNLAVVRTERDQVTIRTSQRSSLQTPLVAISNMVAAAGQLAGAQVQSGGDYPGWKPNPDSPVLQLARETFKGLFGTEPTVTAIHAGLECGIIGDKFPGLDMISFGPTILGAHSSDESIRIPTVKAFWDFLVAILRNLPTSE